MKSSREGLRSNQIWIIHMDICKQYHEGKPRVLAMQLRPLKGQRG